jgi:leucyl-tRNA synthetase
LIKKLTEDILSLPIEVRERQLKVVGSLDESYPIRDAERLFSFDSTNRPVEMHIYQEEEQEDNTKNNESTLEFQQKKYDPKAKSKQSRPFKPALYIE